MKLIIHIVYSGSKKCHLKLPLDQQTFYSIYCNTQLSEHQIARTWDERIFLFELWIFLFVWCNSVYARVVKNLIWLKHPKVASILIVKEGIVHAWITSNEEISIRIWAKNDVLVVFFTNMYIYSQPTSCFSTLISGVM